MSDSPNTPATRFAWLSFPLLIFAASRALLFMFAKAGPLFGPRMGTDSDLARAFVDSYPTLAALGHGEISNYARIARSGYTRFADVPFFPVVPLLGKGLGALFGSLELGLVGLSLVACCAGFVGAYRLFQKLCDSETACWGVALIAAFPFSYHLSDGGASACLLALSTWGVLLARQGAHARATAILSVGVLAHPACALFAVVAATLSPRGGRQGHARECPRWAIAAIPVLVLMGWLIGLALHLARQRAGDLTSVFGHPHLTGDAGKAIKALMVALVTLLGAGALSLLRVRGLRALVLVGVLQIGFAIDGWNSASASALAACWPAFLGMGGLLAKRQSLRAPAVSLLCVHQGLLFYCFTHFLHFS